MAEGTDTAFEEKKLHDAHARFYLDTSSHFRTANYGRTPGLLYSGVCQEVLEGSYRYSCCES